MKGKKPADYPEIVCESGWERSKETHCTICGDLGSVYTVYLCTECADKILRSAPTAGVSPECTCADWLDDSLKRKILISFICPRHGQATIDTRQPKSSK